MMKTANAPDATHLVLNAMDPIHKTALLVISCNIYIIINVLMNVKQVISKIKKKNNAPNV